MKTDDPKLTAYALDELPPAERAEIEALLRDDTALAAEIEATRNFAARLRRELQTEEGAPLSTEQRGELLAMANERVASAKVVPLRVWPQRLLKIAAVVSVCAIPVVLLGVRSYMGAKANVANAGIADPAGWDDYSDFRRLTVRAGDKLTGNNVAEHLGAEGTTDSFASVQSSQPALGRANEFSDAYVLSPANPAPASSRELAVIEVSRESEVLGKNVEGLADVSAGQNLGFSQRAAAGPRRDALASASQNAITKTGAGTSTLDAGTTIVRESVAAETREKMRMRGALEQKPASAPTAGEPQELQLQRGFVRRSDSDFAVSDPAPVAALHVADGTKVAAEALAKNVDELRRTYRFFAPPGEPDRFGGDRLHRFQEQSGNTEAYDAITDNAFLPVKDNPLSTFSIDVDTASYANVRRFLTAGARPPKGAVRIEEMLNYFPYDYPQPAGDAPFSATMEVAACPWTPEHRLVRIGLKGRDVARSERPATNLVFLIDVSGSMQPENKLPLVKESLRLLVDQLDDRDQVAIAVYAGASGTVLEPTRDKAAMRRALGRLEAGGSTNGAGGIQLAYQLAEKSFLKGGTNRVILATDGDFNVGVTNQSDLVELITQKAKSGVFLTVLGFGMGNLKDSTLEKLADKGNGNYGYIDTLAEAKKTLVEQMNSTLFTIAKDVKIQVEFNPAHVGAYRLIGYENRVLAKEDFNDDRKDAGEIGAGHSVTALYEVVPLGGAVPGVTPATDELKYAPKPASAAPIADQSAIRPAAAGQSAISPELLTLKLRYKQPDGDVSTKLEFPLTDRGETWEKSSRDFRWAAAVASFGMLLRDSPHKGRTTWDSTLELAHEGKGEDATGYRAECVALIEKARAAGAR